LRDPMMLSIRRPWWAALALLALAVGCSSEEAAPAGGGDSPAPVAGPAPNNPPPATKEMPPPEAPKTAPEKKDDAAPKTDAPKADAPPKVEAPKVEAPKADAPKGDAPKAAAVKLEDDEIAEIKKLPAAEQILALKQVVCPVSDEHLGSMGMPLKVTAEGKTFYLCCKGCKKDVDADPKAVIAKLGNK
jgi:YHS domain-containing protein